MGRLFSPRVMVDTVLADKSTGTPQRTSRLAISYDVVAPLFATVDAILIATASIVGDIAYQLIGGNLPDDYSTFLGLGLIACIAYALAAWRLGLYNVVGLQRLDRDYLRIFGGWSFVILIITLLLFLLKFGANVSRGSVICFLAISLFLLLLWRLVAKRFVRRALISGAVRGRRGVVVGTRDELMSVSNRELLLVHGVAEIDRIVVPYRSADAVGASKIEMAAVDTALEKARLESADEIILALSWGNSIQLDLIRERLHVSPLPVRLMPDRFIRGILEPGAGHMPLIDVQRGPLTRMEQAIKRLFDIVAAGSILVILAPLMLVTAILVKLDSPGPAIFRQRRNGFNGREFRIYKFRTMTVLEDGPTVAQASKTDGRVTRIGRVLRRYSIDELPQLWNVLSGEMSLVGPRPHAIVHDDEYGAQIINYAFRHHVKPGITGWAQVNGYRGGTPRLEQMKRRIDLDLWYINNWSIGLDMRILLRTCFETFRASNAY